MRLIDHKSRQPLPLMQPPQYRPRHLTRLEHLWSDVHDLRERFGSLHLRVGDALVSSGQVTGVSDGQNVEGGEMGALIGDEREEGRDDECDAFGVAGAAYCW